MDKTGGGSRGNLTGIFDATVSASFSSLCDTRIEMKYGNLSKAYTEPESLQLAP